MWILKCSGICPGFIVLVAVEHVWKYCHIAKTNTGSSQAFCFRRVGDRWLRQPTVYSTKALCMYQDCSGHLCCIKLECMKEKKTWLKMRDWNTNTERHFPLPLQVPHTFLESNMRLSSRCHSKNLAGDFTDMSREWLVSWTEMISSSQ